MDSQSISFKVREAVTILRSDSLTFGVTPGREN